MAAALPFPKSDATFAEEQREAAVGEGPAHQTKTISEVKTTPKVSLQVKTKEIPEISGVYRGRESTRLDGRLSSGITPIDKLIGGGLVRGRVSEIIGPPGAGRTSLAAAFAASITGRGEVAAWIDAAGSCDPGSMATAGVDLARLLWVATPVDQSRSGKRPLDNFTFADERPQSPRAADHSDHKIADRYVANHYVAGRSYHAAKRSASTVVLKAAEWILTAGGFGLLVIDCGGLRDGHGRVGSFTQSAALRLARGAERSGTAVVVIAAHQLCGTFAALSLMLSRRHACFSRAGSGAPTLFDGLTVEARVLRNKLGGAGGATTWSALADPSCMATPVCTATSESVCAPDRVQPRDSHAAPESANHAGRRGAAR